MVQQEAALAADNVYLTDLVKIRDDSFAKQSDKVRELRVNCDYISDVIATHEEDTEQKEQLIAKLQKTVNTMIRADQTLAKLKQLTASTLALLSRNKKAKMVTAHSEVKLEVRDEMALAKFRLRKEDEKANIARFVGIVEQLAGKYSPDFARLFKPNTTNNLVQQDVVFDPEILPEAVPGEFFGLWTYLVEPNEAELEVYEKYLHGPPEPPPIWVPDPRPVVNWARFNTNMHRNLPHPMKFPLFGRS